MIFPEEQKEDLATPDGMLIYGGMRDHEKAEIMRKVRNLTQEELGKAMGVSKQRVSDYLTGKGPVNLKIHQYMGLARILGVTLDSLVDDERELSLVDDGLSLDELAVIQEYRAHRDILAGGTAARLIREAAAHGGSLQGEPAELPGPPPGADPTFRWPLAPRDPLDGVVTRPPAPEEPDKEDEKQSGKRQRTPRKKQN